MLFAFGVRLLLRPFCLFRAAALSQSASGSLYSSRLPGPRFAGARSLRTKWRLHGPPRMGRAQPSALRRAGTKAACGEAEARGGAGGSAPLRRGVGQELALPPLAASPSCGDRASP